MFKYAVPTILTGIAITMFFMFVQPFYSDISTLKTQIASYNEALSNSKTLEAERDKLIQKEDSIDAGNLDKVTKLLPDNVDNIRLVLEIGSLAAPYGMVLKDVKYSAPDNTTNTQTNNNPSAPGAQKVNTDYGSSDLEFSIEGSYFNFLNFMKDLEKNLRIVDVSSISFSSETAPTTGASGMSPTSSVDSYKYSFKVTTYWLKK